MFGNGKMATRMEGDENKMKGGPPLMPPLFGLIVLVASTVMYQQHKTVILGNWLGSLENGVHSSFFLIQLCVLWWHNKPEAETETPSMKCFVSESVLGPCVSANLSISLSIFLSCIYHVCQELSKMMNTIRALFWAPELPHPVLCTTPSIGNVIFFPHPPKCEVSGEVAGGHPKKERRGCGGVQPKWRKYVEDPGVDVPVAAHIPCSGLHRAGKEGRKENKNPSGKTLRFRTDSVNSIFFLFCSCLCPASLPPLLSFVESYIVSSLE